MPESDDTMFADDEQGDPEFLEWLEDQSSKRIETAYRRAEKRELEFWDDESFNLLFHEEVVKMYVTDLTSGLVARGLLVQDVLPDGEISHHLTPGVVLEGIE